MARPRKSGRIYWRQQGTTRRAYGDFRDYADVGGRQEALIPPGAHSATDDEVVASALVTARLEELQEKRRNRAVLHIERETTLGEYVVRHLIEKKRAGSVIVKTMRNLQKHLDAAITFFEKDGPRELTTIKVRHVQDWVTHLAEQRTNRWEVRPTEHTPGVKAKVSDGTVRHYINALSHLYTRAQSEEYVPPGFNPVSSLMDKPTGREGEADWMEVDEAALLLESARTFQITNRSDYYAHFIHPLIATLLLTGGRPNEINGLDVDDLSFDRKTIYIRDNQWRRIKNRGSRRTVHMWPQLEAILREYVFSDRGPKSGPLFPGVRTGKRKKAKRIYPIRDYRKVLDLVADRAGWQPGKIRPKMCRQTYCAARLQTLDNGKPVAPYTVGKELGHGGADLVERVYGRLGDVRHRSEVVEYQIEQHERSERIQDRLQALRKLAAHQ